MLYITRKPQTTDRTVRGDLSVAGRAEPLNLRSAVLLFDSHFTIHKIQFVTKMPQLRCQINSKLT